MAEEQGRDWFEDNPPDVQQPQAEGRDWFQEPYSQTFKGLTDIGRDVLIGATHAGRDFHNLPHNIAGLIDLVGSKMGRALGAPSLQTQDSNIASYLPYDPKDYSETWGQKGEAAPVDYAIQKGVQYAPDVYGVFNALRGLGILPYLTKKGASKSLVKAAELVKNRNLAPLNVNPDLVDDAAQFLPKTTPYKNLINDAAYGDYNRLFKLQSDLGKQAGALSKDWFSTANRLHGRAGLDLRKNILNEMQASLKEQGHNDIADLLSKGQEEYRKYAKIKPYRNAIALTAAGALLPKNALLNLGKKLILMKND